MSKKNRILLSIVCSLFFASSSFSLTKEVKQPAVQEEIKLHRHKLKCWQKFINFFYKFCYKNAYFPEGLFGKLILDNKGEEYLGEELLRYKIFPFLGIKNLGPLGGSCKYMQEVVVNYWKNYLKNAPKNTAEEVLSLNRLFCKAAEYGYFKIIEFFVTNESTQNIIRPHLFGKALCEAAKNNHKKIAEYLILNRGQLEQPSVPNKDEFYGVDGAFEFAAFECYGLENNEYLKAITFLACNKFTQNQLSSPVVNKAMYFSGKFNDELLKILITNKTTQNLLESGDKYSGVHGALFNIAVENDVESAKCLMEKEVIRKLIKKEGIQEALEAAGLAEKIEIIELILNDSFVQTLIDKDVIWEVFLYSMTHIKTLKKLLSNKFSKKFIGFETIERSIRWCNEFGYSENAALLEKFKKEHFKENSVEKKEVKNV